MENRHSIPLHARYLPKMLVERGLRRGPARGHCRIAGPESLRPGRLQGIAMMRLGAAFVAICMVLIAGSLAAILYLWVGLTGIEAVIVALAVLTAMVVYNFASTRIRDQEMVSQQIADLSRGTAELASKVGEVSRRIETAEAAVATAVEKTRGTTGPLVSEIETLGNLVKQLAESVAAHEAVLARTAFGGTAASSMPVHAAAHTATHATPYRAGHADLADTAVRAPAPPV